MSRQYQPVKLIGIAGPSGSGKSELARWLSVKTGARVLNLDHYYLNLSHLPLEVRAKTNFDEPHSVDHDAILEHARALAGGQAIRAPHYSFEAHTRAPGDDLIEPQSCVILEGLFTLYWQELRDLLAVKLYVDAPEPVCLARRLERDIRERGRTRESVEWQFATSVLPGARTFIYPCQDFADLSLSGIDPIDRSGERVLALLSDLT
ncbi:uridine-cytidine kinase [uncultured Paludibaculum sp.]|uniref:uridine kinase family protein n=1 Tax=uncultured Paludibaculum sp. TaxID=1765020 RepID=UPI002AAB905E|nr:uridine-cytidine kinase [uncultured Paludibaculum sp.]